MPHATAEQLRIESRRAKVAELTLRGVRQFDIIAQLGMDAGQRSTISRDIVAIKKAWKEGAVRDWDVAKGEQLDKLDLVEREFWLAWERSKVEKVSTRQRHSKRPAGDHLDAETKKELRDGNPAYLDGVLRCIAKRCEILGLDAPIEIDAHGMEPKIVVCNIIDGRTGQPLGSPHAETDTTTANGSANGNGRLLGRDGGATGPTHGPENGNGRV